MGLIKIIFIPIISCVYIKEAITLHCPSQKRNSTKQKQNNRFIPNGFLIDYKYSRIVRYGGGGFWGKGPWKQILRKLFKDTGFWEAFFIFWSKKKAKISEFVTKMVLKGGEGSEQLENFKKV